MPEGVRPEDTPEGQDCPDGYHRNPQTKRCESVGGVAPSATPEAPKEKGIGEKAKDVAGKVKGNTAVKIMSEYGGNAVKYFNAKAKERFKLGIPCPAGLSKNICKLWEVPNKVMHKVLGEFGKIYQIGLKIKDDKLKESKIAGYDKAMESVDQIVEDESGITGQLTMQNLKAIDDKVTARQKELINTYGADKLKNPKGRELVEARAEFDALATVVKTTRMETSRLKEGKSIGTHTYSANVQRGAQATFETPTGKPIDAQKLKQARKM